MDLMVFFWRSYNINSHKATGPDGIPARLLHEYASYKAPALTKIFQISVVNGD
jgi:hypothetical protein